MRASRSLCRGCLGTALMLMASPGVSATGPTSVVVSGRQLLVNGQPFLIKGVGYSPAPIGSDNPPSSGEDFFMSKYADLHTRDLTALRVMGANTVRLWGWEPNADHTDFLDKAWNGGVNPIHVIVSFWTDPGSYSPQSRTLVRDPNNDPNIISQFVAMISKVKDHPAVLMWGIGNELNASWMYGDDPGCDRVYDLVGKMAQAAHGAEGAAYHPVTTPLMDTNVIGLINAHDANMPCLDVWGVNVYRGRSFGSLFADHASVTTKPLVILEYGIDSYDSLTCQENETAQADYAQSLWQEIASNAGQSGPNRVCIGGSIMEYSDEWWKVKDYTVAPPNCLLPCDAWNAWGHSICGTARDPGAFPDGFSNEEWYGIMRPVKAASPADPDIMRPRQAYYGLQQLWQSEWYSLSLSPGAGGSLVAEPNSPNYAKWSRVGLVAHPDEGYRVRAWTGTDNDSSTSASNTVTMSGPKSVAVEFEQVPVTPPPPCCAAGPASLLMVVVVLGLCRSRSWRTERQSSAAMG